MRVVVWRVLVVVGCMYLRGQRARLLDAAFAVVAEQGYRRMSVRRVSGRAGVSSKTFYDLFSDREDCFLAAFDHAVDLLAGVVVPAWEGEREWTARIRGGLEALLFFLDDQPGLCQICVCRGARRRPAGSRASRRGPGGSRGCDRWRSRGCEGRV